MVSELLHFNSNTDHYWSLQQIGIGSVACLCCVVFLGLKFKWFRAQLNFGETTKKKSSNETVQGVGFKLKSNPDDVQLYNVTSELTTCVDIPYEYKKEGKEKAQNPSTTFNKVTFKTEPSIIPTDTNESTINNNNSLNINSPVPKNKDILQNKTIQINNNASKQQTTNTNIEIQQNKEINKNQDDKINEPINHKSKITFIKNKTSSDVYKQDQQIKTEQMTINENNPLFTKNPLATRNIALPQENEEEWKIRIVDETPKSRNNSNNDDHDEELHLLANNNSNMINSIYSDQAANIFFREGYDHKQPPSSPPPPIPRKFMEDFDDISLTSQSNA